MGGGREGFRCSVFGFQIPVFGYFPTGFIPVVNGFCTTLIANSKPCSAEADLHRDEPGGGEQLLNVSKLSESFGDGFGVFFVHKCVGIAR